MALDDLRAMEIQARTALWDKLTMLVCQFIEVMRREMAPGGGLEPPPVVPPQREKR